ncbi:hypothetical protein GCM10023091_14950 [Ravibacter arvi]|uniref:FecR N-terminal domain-containing protein n=1 Tax=Ravibacter arvi TaxID=2051041 RepID=A0ABP8LTV7_9BACT
MKPFSEYSAEELAMERLFIRWVVVPEDAPIRAFWEKWLEKFPEKRETVRTAAQLVRGASDWRSPNALSGEEVNSIWGRIRSSIGQVNEEPLDSRMKILKIRMLYYKWHILIAAVVILLILARLFS